MSYSSADVRQFLMEAFSDEEIEVFCFDHFPEAQSDFSAGMSKGEKIQRLIEYCQRRDLVPHLFSAIRLARPDQYEKRFGVMLPPDSLELVPSTSEVVFGSGGSLLTNEALLDRLIANQHQAIRYYFLFAVGLVALGTAVIAAAFLLSEWIQPGVFRQLVAIGGLFVSSLSAFQFKEIVARKEKVGIFETLKGRLRTLEEAQSVVDMDTRKRIDNLLWQVIEKTAVR